MSAPGETEDLLQGAKGGDPGDYEALFERMRERLLLYVSCRIGRLKSEVEPQDVVQETYLEAHRSFETFRGGGAGAFVTWLLRIADHRLQDLAKRYGAGKRKADLVRISQVDGIRASGAGPSSMGARSEQIERLRRAIVGALDAEEAEAVLLKHLQELTLEETAARMGKSVKQVRTLLARATWKLGSTLEEGLGQR